MANNKYIAHNGQLIGPVMMNKPHQSRWGDYTGDPATADSVADEWDRYDQHITSLSEKPLPCYGWTPEEGKEYTEGKDFSIEKMPKCGDVECTEMLCWREVAVPITHSQSDSPFEVEHPEEGAAYLTPASPTEQADGGEFLKYVKQSRKDFCTAIHRLPEFNVALRTSVDDMLICFDQMADRLQSQPLASAREGYPADKLNEWSEMQRLYEWLMDESRKPAETFFTSGELRNVAKEIEYRLSNTYPAEFVEWIGVSFQRFHYMWIKLGEDPYTTKETFYTLTELYNHWKNIQSKEK